MDLLAYTIIFNGTVVRSKTTVNWAETLMPWTRNPISDIKVNLNRNHPTDAFIQHRADTYSFTHSVIHSFISHSSCVRIRGHLHSSIHECVRFHANARYLLAAVSWNLLIARKHTQFLTAFRSSAWSSLSPLLESVHKKKIGFVELRCQWSCLDAALVHRKHTPLERHRSGWRKVPQQRNCPEARTATDGGSRGTENTHAKKCTAFEQRHRRWPK